MQTDKTSATVNNGETSNAEKISAQMTNLTLGKLTSYALHLEAIRAAELNQKSESYLLEVLSEVDDRLFHLECGVSSLYQYCVRLLGLSESISYALIAVIRKSKEVPQLKLAIQSGKLTLSKSKKVCSVINQTNFKEWIDLASCETSRVIEKCVAGANPKELVKESAVYKTNDLLEFKLGVGEEFVEALAKIKDLLSQKGSKAVSSEEALLSIMRGFIEKNDPVKKAERAEARRRTKLGAQLVPGTVKNSAIVTETNPDKIEDAAIASKTTAQSKRRPIKQITLNEIALRDQNQCTFIAGNTFGSARSIRCDQKRWLDTHHIAPVHLGGSDEQSNLTTLYKAHHRLIHRKLASSHSSRASISR